MGVGGAGGGVVPVTAGCGAEPRRTEWHFGPAKSVPSPRTSTTLCLLPFLNRYKTDGCLFIFLPLRSNLDWRNTRGQAAAPI